MKDFDIIVVGGGPAGSSAAFHAARGGARVLLLEKRLMPRPKLCGGWVSHHALRLMPFELSREVMESPFLRMTVGDETTTLVCEPPQGLGVFVNRATFDHFMLDRAGEEGVEIVWDKAVSLHSQGSRIRVRTATANFTSDGVIVCTGAAGGLIRQVRNPDDPDQSAVCLEQVLDRRYAAQLGVEEGDGRFVFGSIVQGFGWVLHHGDYLLAGIGRRRAVGGRLLDDYEEFWNLLGLPRQSMEPRGHLVPLGGHSRRLGRGRCLLAGDAAGMVDAHNGEGIAGAIESGRLAAEALLESAAPNPTAAYTALCARSLLPNLKWSRRFAWGFHQNPARALRILAAVPDSLCRYTEVLERRTTYAQYLGKTLWQFAKGVGRP